MLGGISLATPDAPGDPVSTGHRFACATKGEDEWLEWRPRLALGADSLPSGGMLPKPLRASLRWQTKVFGFRRDRQRSGWVLPLADGRLLGPADLLSPVVEALDGKTTLEAAGQSLVLTADNTKVIGPLAVVISTESFAEPATRWPGERMKPADQPVDCLIVTSGIEPLSIAAARFTASKTGWTVASAVSLTADHHGACVVSRETGDVVGVVIIRDTVAIVVPSPG
jgi:hypothetical protein